MRTLTGAALLASVPMAVRAEGRGPSLGARTGWAFPMGDLRRGESLASNYTGMFPLQLDLGYRLSPRWYVGGYVQYGFLRVSSDVCPAVLSCSAHDVRFGANVQWYFLPKALREWSVDPWVGVGAGYEIATVSLAFKGDKASESDRGLELFRAEAGLDALLSDRARLGVVFGLSVDQFATVHQTGFAGSGDFSIPKKGFHSWVMLGLRMRYDL